MSKFLAILVLFVVSNYVSAQSVAEQWKNGLAGSRLMTYSGSVISSSSTLTIIDFCRNGRYTYYKEGSWSMPGTAGGASQNTITGEWDIEMRSSQTYLTYKTDTGELGEFIIYLQNNGRVNIGGVDYAVEQNKSGC